jgi:VanZ family protein
MLAYGVLAVLFFRAVFYTWPDRFTARQLFWMSVCFAGLYGLSDEFHQSFVPSRQADGYDLLADLVGGLLGAAAYKVWISWNR